MAKRQAFNANEVVFEAGDHHLDFIVVESGKIEILNPTDDNRHVAWHDAGQFAGDIDLLTSRPVIVSAIAREPTNVLRVPHKLFRRLLNAVPSLSEKLLDAIQARRILISQSSHVGLTIVGGAECSHTTLVREFLYKCFVPYFWVEPDTDEGRKVLEDCGLDQHQCLADRRFPAIRVGNSEILHCPTLQELARRAGVWQSPPKDIADLAIIGAGPAGMAAAVYAASEGLRTVVLDRLGPGGQAGDSSRIENFIGFPSGLSGADLAARATLQMLKFGATICAPICVTRIEPATSENDPHLLHLEDDHIVRARTVLVAVGVNWRRLEARNAKRFDRKGVYYACTSVESDAHMDQDVAVVGAGNSAGQAAMFLAEQCERTVHLVVRGENLKKGMSTYLSSRIEQTKNIIVHFQREVEEVIGDARIDRIRLKSAEGKSAEELPLGAIFVFIGGEPKVDWLPKEIERDDKGYVLTGSSVVNAGKWPLSGRLPCPLETSVPRILAGGDIRAGSTKRVGFAVGDGSLAVTCAHSLRG
jgi:thioredoxin reductase (NADPH)